MRSVAFGVRTAKEILRDPINLAFGVGLPVALILLFSAIQANVPVELFEIHKITPGIAVFSLSFLTLFSSVLVAKDRQSAFLQRLYATPTKPVDFIVGYALPLLPIGLLQTTACYLTAVCLGHQIGWELLLCLVYSLPACLVFIGFGILFGSFLTDKQAGGICGSLMTNVSALLSGAWFDLSMVGGVFEKVANVLPFVHAVEMQRAVFGTYEGFWVHLLWVTGYAVVACTLAVAAFFWQKERK